MKQNVLIDTWYASHLGDDLGDSVNQMLDQRCPPWLASIAERNDLVRGLLIFAYGRTYDLIVTVAHHPGWWVLLFLEAWFGGGKRKVVLLEFLRGKVSPGWRRIVYPPIEALIIRPSLRRALRVGQVLTAWESAHYARMYDLPPERFRFIPFQKAQTGGVLPKRAHSSQLIVLSSGRAACDWETLFKAANASAWSLTVICRKRDLRHINRLNRDGRAQVLCDVSKEIHQRCLEAATVYVISLQELLVSSGQVRLQDAVQAGIPVVATNVKGLAGYVTDQETALLVAPGDHRAMRQAIERLLVHPEERERLASTALEQANLWTSDSYFASLRALILELLPAPQPAGGILQQ